MPCPHCEQDSVAPFKREEKDVTLEHTVLLYKVECCVQLDRACLQFFSFTNGLFHADGVIAPGTVLEGCAYAWSITCPGCRWAVAHYVLPSPSSGGDGKTFLCFPENEEVHRPWDHTGYGHCWVHTCRVLSQKVLWQAEEHRPVKKVGKFNVLL